MDALWGTILGFSCAIILHEITHLIVILYYKIPILGIVLTKWSAFGFLVDNESYINDRKKLILLHFSPLIWCLLAFANPRDIFFLMFPIVNLTGGLGDMYYYLKITSMTAKKRVEWSHKNDKKIFKSVIWMKEF